MPQTRSRTTAQRKLSQTDDLPGKNSDVAAIVPTASIESLASESPISISTRFNPEELDMFDADIVLLASDQVYFYSHQAILLRNSSKRFGSLLQEFGDANMEVDAFQPVSNNDLLLLPTAISVPYPSGVLNLVLHMIYGLSVVSYKPTPATLRAALAALFELNYNLEAVLTPHSEPYMLFLQSAVVEPLPMYALAAQYCLEPIAVAVSTFTLGESLSEISDDLARQIGSIYLRRLFFLHLGRTDALRRLLYPPPSPHSSSPDFECSEKNHQEVRRIWALACASAIAENHPNNLAKLFAPLSAQLSCFKCRQALHERVGILISDWSSIKTTI